MKTYKKIVVDEKEVIEVTDNITQVNRFEKEALISRKAQLQNVIDDIDLILKEFSK